MDTALETGPDRFRKGLLRGEALGERPGGGERAAGRLGALDVGEDAVEELVAPACERLLNPLDVAEVGANADDHWPILIRAKASPQSRMTRPTVE